MKLLLQVAGYELTGVAAVTAASILFLLILWLLKILFGRLCNRLDRWRDSGRAALKVKRFELLSVCSAHQLLTIALKVPRALVTLALLDVYLRFVLNEFEATRGLVSEYGGLIWGPLGQLGQAFLGYLPRLFQLVVLVVVAYFVLKLLYALFRSVQEGDVEIRGFYPDWAVPTYKLVRFFVLMLVVIFALPLLPGSSSDTFRGVSIFLGVLVALASTSALGNVISGIALIYTRAFQIGDWVQIENSTGEVIRTSLIATRILTRQNVVVTIPNGNLVRATVDNYGRRRYRRFKTHLSITYDTPPDKIEAFCEGIRELIRLHPYARKDYYQVWLHQFGPSSLDVLVYMFHEAPDWTTELRERQRLMLDIIRLADHLGVEFAFPTETVHLYQESPDAKRSPADAPGTGDDERAEREGRRAVHAVTAAAGWRTRQPEPYVFTAATPAQDADDSQIESKRAGRAG